MSSRQGGSSQGAKCLVDVCFVGASAQNLASALALSCQFEGIKVKVYEAAEQLQEQTFILGLSPKVWEQLTSMAPGVTRRLINEKSIVEDGSSGNAEFLTGTIFTTHAHLLNALASALPPNTVIFGKAPESMKETPEGMELLLKDGSTVFSKLLVSSSESSFGCTAASKGAQSGWVEVSMKLQGWGESLALSQWTGKGSYATYHSLGGKNGTITFVGAHQSSDLNRSVDFLKLFPELHKCSEALSVEDYSLRSLQESPKDRFGRGRLMISGTFLEASPQISPQWSECMLNEAVLLTSTISEKGLTPAALRECERMIQHEHEAKVASIGDTLNVDRIKVKDHKEHVQVTPAPLCNVTFAKGLKYPAPRDGMGWRIMS